MKTIREIAEEIGVSKQAVYKRYKGKLYKSVLPYARMVSGTVYILEQGESIIKQDFLYGNAYSGAHTEYARDPLTLMLQKELGMLRGEIAQLTATIKTQSVSANKFQKSKPPKVKRRIAPSPKSPPIERLFNK